MRSLFTPYSLHTLSHRLPLLLALALGCSPQEPVSGPPVVSASVTITPATTLLRSGDSLQMRASVTGLADTAVEWSVDPIIIGAPGTISPQGLYRAPIWLGKDSVVVTIRAVARATPRPVGIATIIVRQRPIPRIVPGAGSIYGYRYTSEVNEIPNPDSSGYWRMEQTGLALAGRDSVVRVSYNNAPDGLIRFEPDGDISVTREILRGEQVLWGRYPFGSHTPVYYSIDSVLANGDRYTYESSTLIVGTEPLLVPAGAFITHHVQLNEHEIRRGADTTFSKRTTTEFWYAPEAGWYARRDILTVDAIFGTHFFQSVRRRSSLALTGYTVK